MVAMAAILEICFELLLNRKANWLKTCKEILGPLKLDQKERKSFESKIQAGRHGVHFEKKSSDTSYQVSSQQAVDLKLGRKYQSIYLYIRNSRNRSDWKSKMATIGHNGTLRWPS